MRGIGTFFGFIVMLFASRTDPRPWLYLGFGVQAQQMPAGVTPEMIALARGNAVKVGLDYVDFRLGEIDPAVLKRTPGEFARLGLTQAGETGKRPPNRSDHGPTAMEVQLGDVLMLRETEFEARPLGRGGRG